MHLLSSISVISYSDEPGSKRILKESFVMSMCDGKLNFYTLRNLDPDLCLNTIDVYTTEDAPK